MHLEAAVVVHNELYVSVLTLETFYRLLETFYRLF